MSTTNALASLVPGLLHLRRGHRRTGARFLFLFAVWLAVVVGRFPAILRAAERRSLEDLVALAFLVAMPVGLVLFARRSLVRWAERPSSEGLGSFGLAWRAFRRNARGTWGLTALGLIYTVAFLCPILAPFDPGAIPTDTAPTKMVPPFSTLTVFGDVHRGETYARSWRVEGSQVVLGRGPGFPEKRVPIDRLGAPRWGWSRAPESVRTVTIAGRDVPYRRDFHLLGTDTSGRDVLSRIVYGSRISLVIGFAAVGIMVTLGILFGATAGYLGGFPDGAIMRLVDVLLAFPRLLLLLLIVATWPRAGIFTTVVVLGATGWMGVARLVRAEFLRLRTLDFATAARALGFGRLRIMFRHLLPNSLAPVIVAATLGVGGTILVEAALSYLGMGVQQPTPSWGNIINDGRGELGRAWWIATAPGLAIVATVVCFNLVGDALRDALDPRLRL